VLKLSKRSTVHAVERINLNTANKVVTVVVYSTAPFMLAKVVDGTSGPESAAELVILVVDGKHLIFDFIQR
jgi:hypothetical protein